MQLGQSHAPGSLKCPLWCCISASLSSFEHECSVLYGPYAASALQRKFRALQRGRGRWLGPALFYRDARRTCARPPWCPKVLKMPLEWNGEIWCLREFKVDSIFHSELQKEMLVGAYACRTKVLKNFLWIGLLCNIVLECKCHELLTVRFGLL